MYSKQELHKRREGLSAHKKELLAQRLQRRGGQENDRQAIPKRAEKNILPLSFAQRRLWFLQQLEPENPVYNETLALRLTGQLKRESLQLALHEIARRHEILRTTFTVVDGDVQQMIHPPDHRSVTLSQVEWPAISVAQRESAAIDWMRQQTQQAFTMADNVLWKATLLHLSSEEHILFIVLHHIICDSWSLGLFMHELAAIYPALSQGKLDPLPEPAIQYGDYLLWQRQHFAGNTLETLLAYWKKHLAGAPALLELPTDHPRQPRAGYQAQRLPFQFSAAQTRDIHIAIKREGITLFMLLLTALAITLARYSRQDEIVIGTPVAGRTAPELEAVFGLFVNMLALRINLTGNPTLRALVQQIRTVALAAYAYQDMPFEKLVEEMHVPRLQGQSPFFQVVLDLQHSSLQQMAEAIKEVDGVRIAPVPLWNDRAKFDLTFVLNEHEQGLDGQLIYNSDLWDAASMRRLLEHWQRVIQALLIKPEQRLSQVSLLSNIERDELLAQWSKPLHPLSAQSIPQLFELQVAHTPESIALAFQDIALTYLELNRRANRLARYLQQRGVLPGTPVGAHLERSPELIIALLAILKVGGTYVPLDPVYPPERLSFLLQDCAIAVLLTQKELYAQFPDYSATALVVGTEAFIQKVALQGDENLAWQPDQQLLAYIIYTSGTTGKPKGVYVTHRAAANHLLTMQKTFGICQGERVLLFATSAFDVSLEQTLTPLISGATLVLKDAELWHSHDLTRQIAAMALTVVNLPTAYWQQWMGDMIAADAHDALLTALRLVIAGGDKVVPEMVRLWFQMPMAARVRLLNAYGPTEATITTSVFAITAQPPADPSLTSIPIGSPLPNRTYYVLDNYGEPVPPGIVGELYIGGPLLACGYLHRPILTAECFVPDPFGGEPGARLYRTGDLVRAHHNGNLEVLGRADLQVKIRGFRIELGEIEAVLAEHPQVREVAVVARAGQQEKYLVAYVVPVCKNILDVVKLYQYLVGCLPRYMVPAHIVPLDSLPLTSNGKLDRQTLAHLAPYDFSTTQTAYIAPQTPLEAALAAIWCDLLSVPQIGRYDNFFTSGGHSLLAIRLVSRILQVLHINCPLSAVFECPTLAALAEYLLQCREEEGQEMLSSILENDHNRRMEQEISLPLSFHQQRLWFLDQLQPGLEQYNLSVAIRIDGLLNIAALERSLNALIERHESLRTIFTTQEEPQQVVLPTLTITLKQQDLQLPHQDTREIQAQQLIQAEAHRPFKLAGAPLLRVLLLQMQAREYILLLTMHHIICDGWSIGILFKELLALYTAFSRGEPAPLTPLNVQYRHYTRWQRLWLQGERSERQLAYWQQQLRNAPPLLALPTDYPRTASTELAGSQQSIVLACELVDQLQALSQSEHVTLFATLLAAIKLLLYRMSGQDDIVVGVPHMGRPRVEFEQVIGLFANMLPLRTDLSGSPTFKQLLARVHNVSLAAFINADVPFEQIVQILHREPTPGYHPLFQVEVAFQKDLLDVRDLSRQSHNLLDLSIHGIEVNVSKVKLDLAFSIAESEQGLTLTVEYSTDLFTDTTIARMLGYLQTLLSEIVHHPERSVTRLPLLSDAEQCQLLSAATHDAAAPLPEETFYQLFSRQAGRTPEAPAVIYAEQQITYCELERACRQLASSLAAYNIGPEVIVALLAERNANFLITILALFRLGAAYLPLDPRAPVQRQQQLIAQSRAALLLIDRKHATSLPVEAMARQILPPVIVIEDLLVQAQQRPEDRLSIDISYSQNQLAYVIYTSGSTGVPKGAMIEQRGMLNHLYAKIVDLNLTERDTVAQTASQCFDISVWQLLAPLLVGGCVNIFADEIAHDPTRLLQHIQRHEIAVFETVPSLLRAMLDEIAQRRQQQPYLSSLRWLLLTGEALRADLCLQWHLLYPHIRVMNAYGPTECSDDVTHYVLPTPLQNVLTTVPIGRAIANMQVYVLDPEMQPVPLGVIGEVYCGGVGVGRGYLLDPCRTAESYLPHPFVGTRFIASERDLSPSCQTGARLYKTGDLARVLSDGSIEYCGRVDQQVKIRGFRIEPGEIENILRQQQVVREAVVTSRQSQNNDAYLVAYIVLQPQQLEIDRLIHSLKGRLPEYMIPAHFVQLPGLPLNANGKINYAALPEPERGQQRESDVFIAPRSATEQVIARIWAGALELDPAQLSIQESFFSLGGHSLLATRVMARLRSIFPADLSLRSFFEHPTIAEFAQFLLTHETKPGYIEKIAASSSIMASLASRPEAAPPLASFSQRRFWLLEQLQTEQALYTIPTAYAIDGALNIALLEQSLNQVTRRHDVLRTTFVLANEDCTPVIHPPSYHFISVIDLDALAEEERMATAISLITDQARKPFNLVTGPLFHTMLVRLKHDAHLLLLAMHHSIADGESIALLLKEMAASYQAYAAGDSPLLPTLPLQYADYAYWQRQMLQDPQLETRITAWQHYLTTDIPPLELPADYPPPIEANFRGALLAQEIQQALVEQLRSFSKQQGTTPFMVLLTAFQLLLHRYTEQNTIIVGSPVSGRVHQELEQLLGCFVNTIAIRTELSGNPSFLELLARVRISTLEAYSYQDIPFEKLVESLQLERSQNSSPIFQVMFSYERIETRSIGLDNLALHPVAIDTGTAKFALTLFIAESENGLTATVEYNTDLFAPTTISRLLQHFQRILAIMLAHPEQHIRDFSLLSPQEMASLVSEQKPDMQVQKIPYQSIVQIFEAQAVRSPDALALIYEQEMLTYAQLNERANQLARLLAQSGVGFEIPVALFFERSIDLIISMLAVLKAGGIYIPLDIASPPERLAFIIQDCGASLVLSQRALLELLPHKHAQVLCLDDLHTALMALPAINLPGRITAQNLAYCIYTSGSTGTPKGVQVEHAQLLNLLLETQSIFAFSPDDAWTLFHSPAFDFSVWEIWGALFSGGRLIIVPYWVTRSPQELWELLLQQNITILNQTPSALRQLLLYADMQAAAKTTALRLVILGGEAINVASLHPWFECWGEHGPALVSMYGITETTVHVTQRRLQKQDLLSPFHSPIGQPLHNMQIYLLDPYMQPVPTGVTGEIYVGGTGLARGYLNLPDLTAERFVPNPFIGICFGTRVGTRLIASASEPGARLYKSGDLARLLPSGELVYQGRIDQQVKIRGFRIELGEIERVLCRHPAIREAVVRVAGTNSTERHLIAYLVISPGDEAQVTTQRMRDYLSARLPDYMLPVAYVVLERLPLTANNKIDYQALPAPERQLPASDQPFVVPQTFNEQILAEIWQQVLGVERVGLYDNFFALGGDSIRSIQVLARAKQRGLHFSLQQLFQYQTVYALNRVLQVGASPCGCPAGACCCPIPNGCPPFSLLSDQDRAKLPSGLVDAYPLTMLQAGMLYHMQLHPDAPLYHNVFSLYIKAPFSMEGLRQAVQQVVERHAVLRTSFDLTTFSEPLQLVHQSVSFPITYDDLRYLAEDEQEKRIAQFIAEEEQRLFALSVPPLLRFHIHRRGESSFQFTLTENHAILDGWSLMSTLAEIFDLHSAFLQGQNLPQQAPLAASFSDFVAYERQVLLSEAHHRYWQQKLQEYTFNQLAGNVSSDLSDRQCYSLEYAVPQDTYQGLRNLAAEASVPLKSVLLAAHVKAMSVMSGQSDVLTGLTSEGRPEQEDGEQVRGLFLNVAPLRQQLQHCSWFHLVKTTFMTEIELLPFRHYPLAAIQRDAGGEILFETLFTYLHFHAVAHLARQQDFAVLDTKRSEKNNFAVNASFMLDPLHDRLSLQLDLDATRFSKAQCEALLYCYRQVLQAMVDDPHQGHAAQSFLSSNELQKMLVDWNQPLALLPQRLCLHQLFAEQAARTPDAPALISPDLTLTYRQLDQQTNQLAHFLREMQIGPDVPVVIYLERSPALIICMLGILKAGGAYVPFDSLTPPQRLSRMLEDAQAAMLLTQESLQPSLPDAPVHTVYVEQVWSQLALYQGETAPASAVQPENLAYIIYTSGSTGEPKGVMVPHAGLVNYVTWAAEAYEVAKGDSSPLHTSPGFDLAVTSIFPALLVGKPVILLGEHCTVEDLVPLLRERSCRPLKLTPAHLTLLNQLLDAEPANTADRKLRSQLFVIGGEALTAEALSPWLRQEPGSKFINEYGPTEASVGCCIYQASGHREHTSAIPIGRPIAHTQLYVLDAFMQPVPEGVAGELYIGGPSLARGYLHAPDLTAERFLPNPFVGTSHDESGSYSASEAGARLYKTGDLARLLPCGELEFLGRLDQQVKIRGFRIEPAEVAAQVMRHPSVQESIVVCRKIHAGEKQLIAYLSLRPGCTFDESDLRSFLRANLPDYMLPFAYVLLEKLPLTVQGKIDRAALPLPDEIAHRRPVAFMAPATPLEQLIADVWSDVLQREDIGTLDNFFALGGHSLSAMQVVSRLRADLQVELSLRTFLEHPTIAELIAILCQDDELRERLEKIALIFKMVVELSDDEVRSMLHTRNALIEEQ